MTMAAVFVLLRNDKGEFLLQQRANTGYLDGYYDFACSGHVEPGELIRDTAVRELQEEVGLTAKPEDLKLVHIDQYFLDRDYINFVSSLASGKASQLFQSQKSAAICDILRQIICPKSASMCYGPPKRPDLRESLRTR